MATALEELEEQVSSLIERQDNLVICYFCQVDKATVCKFGFGTCPWAQDETFDAITLKAQLPGVVATSNPILDGSGPATH